MKFKWLLTPVTFFLFCYNSIAQSVGVNTTTPDASAILDVKSSDKGMLIPRTSTASRTAIVGPAKGLVLYDTTTNSFWYHNGSVWVEISGGSSNAWNITGNPGTNAASNFIGTTDNQSLRFKVNNNYAGEINASNNNIGFGIGAGYSNVDGHYNSFFGHQSGFKHKTGDGNAFFGWLSGYEDSSGAANSFFGVRAGQANTTGSGNAFFGNSAGSVFTTSNYNSCFGYGTASFPITTVSGSNNCLFGSFAGNNGGAGNDNSFFGSYTGYSNEIGYSNVAIGSNALYSSSAGHNIVAVGDSALYKNNANSNTAVGSKAGYANTGGTFNTFIGSAAGKASNGSYNSFLGQSAGEKNSTGSDNTFVGYKAGDNITAGSSNTFVGSFANTTAGGGLNYAASLGYGSKVSCSNCLALGGLVADNAATRVGINNPTPLTDLHIIQQTDEGGDKVRGLRLQRSVNTNHWRIMIDPSNNLIFEYNDVNYSYIDPNTRNYVNPSDVRLKKDINSLDKVIDKLMRLDAKTYHYIDNQESDPLNYGFLAQDVQKVFPDFVSESKDNGMLGLSYSNFGVVAIKAIQEQQKEIELLKREIELLKQKK